MQSANNTYNYSWRMEFPLPGDGTENPDASQAKGVTVDEDYHQ